MTRISRKEILGQRFGRLVVIEENEWKPNRSVKVKCDCGVVKMVKAGGLCAGKVSSCGCYREELRTKHGHNRKYGGQTSTYTTWHSMLQRCLNKNSQEYPNYGARGIAVCERWRDFKNFLFDMGEKPKGTHIDRIDNNKGYSKDNCRWVTPRENMQNKRTCVYVEAFGKRLTLMGWESETGINHETLRSRLLRGVSPEVAVIPGNMRHSNR